LNSSHLAVDVANAAATTAADAVELRLLLLLPVFEQLS